MSQWNDFLAQVEKDIVPAAKQALAGFVDEARSDANAFVTAAQNDLKSWTAELAAGQITADDVTAFVKADAALAEMAALTAAGIGAADAQRFRDTMINIVINAAIGTFKP